MIVGNTAAFAPPEHPEAGISASHESHASVGYAHPGMSVGPGTLSFWLNHPFPLAWTVLPAAFVNVGIGSVDIGPVNVYRGRL